MSVAVWEPSTSVARIDSWTTVVAEVAQLAQTIADTDFVPNALRGNVPAITAAILYGREISLGPMIALRSVQVIQGRPSLAAEAMRGLALAAGHEIVFEKADGGTCTVRGRRRGQTSWHTVTWTIDNAQRLGLTRNPSWSKYPRAMLKARATSELCRDLFADVIGGFGAVEDMDVLPEGAVEVEDAPAPPTRTVKRASRSARPTVPPREDDDPSREELAAPEDRSPLPPPPAPSREPTEVVEPTRVLSAEDHHLREDDRWSEEPLPIPPEPPNGGSVSVEDPPPPPPDVPQETGEAASREQGRHVFALLGDLGYQDAPRNERLRIASAIVGRSVSSFNELTRREASSLIDTLAILAESADGRAQLDAIVSQVTP